MSWSKVYFFTFQAIIHVSHLISAGNFKALEGLVDSDVSVVLKSSLSRHYELYHILERNNSLLFLCTIGTYVSQHFLSVWHLIVLTQISMQFQSGIWLIFYLVYCTSVSHPIAFSVYTFNNISIILWHSVLLVEETRVFRENHDMSQVTDKLYHIMLYWVLLTMNKSLTSFIT